MRRFDRVVLATVLVLALAIGAVSVAAVRLGPSVDSLTTAQVLDGASVDTQIGITFTEPMDARSVQRNFRFLPAVRGDFSWSGNELFFAPRHSLAYSTRYRLLIGHSARARTGHGLSHDYVGTFMTQSQHLIYLGTGGSERGRLVLASVGGRRTVVGVDDGLVTDFSVSVDRSLVVYAKRGAPGERADEIWILSLADNSTQRVFQHADWSISQPHFSPDGKTVAFLAGNVRLCRPYYGCFRNQAGSVVELLSLGSNRAKAFRPRSDVPLTNFVDFSPSGQIAYTDLGSALTLADPTGNNVVHIPNRGNSPEFAQFDRSGVQAVFVGQTPSSSGGDILVYSRGNYLDASRGVYDSSTPAFSNSGKQIAYAAYRGERGIEPVYGINVYNLAQHRTKPLTGERLWSDWEPSWSADDRYIAFVRSVPQEAMYMGSGEVWIMRSDGSAARPLGGVGRHAQWVV